jgi:hypothetical protein
MVIHVAEIMRLGVSWSYEGIAGVALTSRDAGEWLGMPISGSLSMTAYAAAVARAAALERRAVALERIARIKCDCFWFAHASRFIGSGVRRRHLICMIPPA